VGQSALAAALNQNRNSFITFESAHRPAMRRANHF
jgi:hypothetical protein